MTVTTELHQVINTEHCQEEMAFKEQPAEGTRELHQYSVLPLRTAFSESLFSLHPSVTTMCHTAMAASLHVS